MYSIRLNSEAKADSGQFLITAKIKIKEFRTTNKQNRRKWNIKKLNDIKFNQVYICLFMLYNKVLRERLETNSKGSTKRK